MCRLFGCCALFVCIRIRCHEKYPYSLFESKITKKKLLNKKKKKKKKEKRWRRRPRTYSTKCQTLELFVTSKFLSSVSTIDILRPNQIIIRIYFPFTNEKNWKKHFSIFILLYFWIFVLVQFLHFENCILKFYFWIFIVFNKNCLFTKIRILQRKNYN